MDNVTQGNTYNPKALQKESIDPSSNKKVTVGFKCSPTGKLRLIKESEDRGMTLSEYVESIIIKHHEGEPTTSSTVSNTKEVDLSEDSLEMVKLKVVESLDERDQLKRSQATKTPIAETTAENISQELKDEIIEDALSIFQESHLIFDAPSDYIEIIDTINERREFGGDQAINGNLIAKMIHEYLNKEAYEDGVFGIGAGVDKEAFAGTNGIDYDDYYATASKLLAIDD